MRIVVVTLVWLGGAVLGWNAAAATHGSLLNAASAPLKTTSPFAEPASSTLVVVPVPSAMSRDYRRTQEIERLEARNRRLEALVRVLRNRETERTH